MRAIEIVVAVLSLTSCMPDDGAYDELGIDCEGKCDGLSSVRSLVGDIKKLDVQDLVNVGASFATDQLDVKLGGASYAGIQLEPTELYAPSSVAANDLTLHDLDQLAAGLATRFGDGSLATEVNAVRAEHLASSGKRVYAESAFRIDAGLGHGWTLGTAGFGADATANAQLGFGASTSLEARVITVHASENAALVQSPLAAAKASRGFILPRSLADVRAMAPGESFALSGHGKLGANLGAGVPILIANPSSFVTYSLVLSAGLRSVLDGQLDVQLVRLRGDEVVIDVGVETAKVDQAQIALRDGFGVQGLIEQHVDLAGQSVDLGKLLDRALQKRVASKLHVIQAAAERTTTSMRLSVARLRFSLDDADPTGGREAALAQALRGDLRLAQVLAARGDSGVVAEFDLVRSGASAISYAGVDLLGMKFYRRTATGQGDAVIQTPGSVLALMWESLHRESGWFFTSHGSTRVNVAGLRFDARMPGVAKGETNLFIQTEEGDRFMERDKVIDQLDSVLVSVGGFGALTAIERKGNELERLIVQKCPLPAQGEFFDETCNINLIRNDAQVRAARDEALRDLDDATFALPADIRALVRRVGELRLSAQMIEDPNAGGVGPTASMVVDFRLDDAALRGLFGQDRTAFAEMVVRMMQATQLARTSTNPVGERDKIRSRSQKTADAMAAIFDDHRQQYARLVSVDGAKIQGLGEIGANAIEVRYPVDSKKRPLYEDAVGQSIAQARANVAGAMFDALRAEASDMPGSGGSRAAHPEQIASFTLLGLSPIDHTELRVDLKTESSSSRKRYTEAGFTSVDQFAKGPSASPIAVGLFDIDAIIDTPR